MKCKLLNFGFFGCVLVAVIAAMILSGCGTENSVESKEPIASQTEQPFGDQVEKETQEPVTADYNKKPGEADGFMHCYPLGITVRYDLNGDGIGEDITVTAQEYSEGQLKVGTVEAAFDAITPTGYFTILNVNQNDRDLLIGISDYGFSDDPMTVLYAYDGVQLTEVGYYEDITGSNDWGITGAVCHGDGTISAKERFDVLGTWEAWALYGVELGKLIDITDVYYYVPWEPQSDGWEVTAMRDLIMYEDIWNSETENVVPAGTKLLMTGMKRGSIDDTYWACFEVKSLGKSLWLAAEVVEWYTNVSTTDGFICSEDAFDGFFYAG